MSSGSIETVTRMLESLPESAQDRVVEHLREYIETLADELRWNGSFEKTQSHLAEAARRAREEIASGHAEPMDYDQL
jgi:hypothetical protein